jgi:hypothetical protein
MLFRAAANMIGSGCAIVNPAEGMNAPRPPMTRAHLSGDFALNEASESDALSLSSFPSRRLAQDHVTRTLISAADDIDSKIAANAWSLTIAPFGPRIAMVQRICEDCGRVGSNRIGRFIGDPTCRWKRER